MKIRTIIAAVAISLTSQVNAQWDTLNSGVTYRLNAIAANDPNMIGVVAVGFNPATDSGAYGTLVLSGDNGNTWWEQAEEFAPNLELHDIDFTDNQRAWIVGDSGMVVLRTIWFLTYTSANYISPYNLLCGYPVNDSVFSCAGEHGVAYRTFDYGNSWDTLSTGTSENINDIYFTDAANGWIVADGGYMAFTSDSGSTWTFVAQPMFGFEDINGFAYQGTSGLSPYFVGTSGLQNYSVNGGVSWSTIPWATTTNDLHKIRFMNDLSGIICGDNGHISRSEDGGGFWFTETAPTSQDLYDIAFAGDTTAFICGDSGVVLRSNRDISSVRPVTGVPISANVYPNPNDGQLFISLRTEAGSNVEIQLLDMTGRVISTNYNESVSGGENRFEIETENLASGIYFVKIQTNEQVVTLPVIRR